LIEGDLFLLFEKMLIKPSILSIY